LNEIDLRSPYAAAERQQDDPAETGDDRDALQQPAV